jgi:D-serine deaminase-like pyridoxal phosphate-dependent protein
MSIYSTITSPTLLLDADRCRANLARMVEKAKRSGVRFRPHFKTIQSARIGEWFRAQGVTGITVSSVAMAKYFAAHYCTDILIAFPVNVRQIDEINELAKILHLELLVESVEAAAFLGQTLLSEVDIWIKVDAGSHRTGIPVEDSRALLALAREIRGHKKLRLRGILTHAGHTYKAGSVEKVKEIYKECVGKMEAARQVLTDAGLPHVEISWGDTPSCALVEDLSAVDEIRPGNFALYDVMQAAIGSCKVEDIAAAVACPVVAKHPERGQVIIYGGAIHLSKEYLEEEGKRHYGLVALPEKHGWSAPIPGAFIPALSQEHGVVILPKEVLEKVKVGDLLVVLPVHVCLAVGQFAEFVDLEGKYYPVMRLEAKSE